MAAGANRLGMLRRFPLGPVAAITPFNFPLNLVAHKLAPALAAGCTMVLKPATKTPMVALMLADVVARSGYPQEAVSILPMTNQTASPLIEDERFKLLTFTGSSAVGWSLKARAGRRKSRWNWAATRAASCTRTPTWTRRWRAASPEALPMRDKAASACSGFWWSAASLQTSPRS